MQIIAILAMIASAGCAAISLLNMMLTEGPGTTLALWVCAFLLAAVVHSVEALRAQIAGRL